MFAMVHMTDEQVKIHGAYLAVQFTNELGLDADYDIDIIRDAAGWGLDPSQADSLARSIMNNIEILRGAK